MGIRSYSRPISCKEMNISVATIQKLPLHDARLSSISITPTAAGMQVRLSIEINEDEDMEPFQSLGLQQRGIDFSFQNAELAKLSLRERGNFYHSDANGNITCMINSAQTIVASYKYDPFGRIESQSGSLANDNVYRFSSKEVFFKTTAAGGPSDLYYYGFRFYDPQPGAG